MSKNAEPADLVAVVGPTHPRTPDNTPIPGGGRWTWDADAGAWVSLDTAPAAPQQQPPQE